MIVRALLGGNEMDFAEPPLRVSGVFYWSHWGTGDLLKKALQKPRAGKDAGRFVRNGIVGLEEKPWGMTKIQQLQ